MAMTEVQGGGKSAQVRWLVWGAGARHPIGQNRRTPNYTKKRKEKPKDEGGNEQMGRGNLRDVDLTVEGESEFSEREPGGGHTATGAALCGKSLVLRKRINYLRSGLGMALSGVFLGMHRSDNH